MPRRTAAACRRSRRWTSSVAGRTWRGRGPLVGKVAFLAGVLALAVGVVSGCRSAAGEQVVFHAEGQPESLSEWHLFDLSGGRMVPNERVLPYDLNTPLFTDYAHKLRTV